MIVICSRNMRVIVTSKESFPESVGVTLEVSDHWAVVLFGVCLLQPLHQTSHVESHRFTRLVNVWIQDVSGVMQRT